MREYYNTNFEPMATKTKRGRPRINSKYLTKPCSFTLHDGHLQMLDGIADKLELTRSRSVSLAIRVLAGIIEPGNEVHPDNFDCHTREIRAWVLDK